MVPDFDSHREVEQVGAENVPLPCTGINIRSPGCTFAGIAPSRSWHNIHVGSADRAMPSVMRQSRPRNTARVVESLGKRIMTSPPYALQGNAGARKHG